MAIWNLVSFFITLSLVSCASYDLSRSKEYVAAAHNLHQRGEWDESLEYLYLMEKNAQLTDDLQILKVQNLIKLGQVEAARNSIESAIDFRPHSEALHVALAQWYFDEGEIIKAEQTVLKIFNHRSSSLAFRKILAKIYLHQAKWSKARNVLEPKSESLDEESLFWLGQTYYKENNFPQAIKIFTRTFNAQEFSYRSAQYLAWLFTEKKDVANANNFIRFLIKEAPEHLFTQKMIVRNLLNMPQVDKVSVLSEFTQEHQDEWMQYQYWIAMKNTGMKDQAIDYLATLWNQYPGTPWIVSNYSLELKQTGASESAVMVLQRSLKHCSETGKTFLNDRLAALKSMPSEENRRDIAAATGVLYRVRTGDTLQTISLKFFNTVSRWSDIYQLNRKIVPRPEYLSPGIDIEIPENR